MTSAVNPSRKLHSYVLAQKFLLLIDLLLTLLSENQKHIFFVVAGCYFLQFVCLVANILILFVLFTNTYAFKAGVVKVMLNEFNGTLIAYGIYFFIFVVTRGYGGVRALMLNHRCNTGHVSTRHALFGPRIIRLYIPFSDSVSTFASHY